jgi:FHS family glucose/mannose:H+ symporter-like MFS transporter
MAQVRPSWKSTKAWLIPVVFAWASLFSLGIVDNSRGPVFPDLLTEFALSDTLGSFFFLLASFASVVHNLTFRKFLAESSPLRLVGLYTLIMAAGSMVAASAESYWVLLASALLLGIGFGGVGVGQNAAVQEAPARYRARSMGLLHAMYGISSFLAPLIVATLQPYGWRMALLFASVPALLVGSVIVGRLGLERLKGWHRRRRSMEFPIVVDMQRGPNESPHNVPAELTRHQRERAARFAAILIGFLVVAEISISSRMALLARREWGVSSEAAGTWLAAYFAAMTMARFSLGFLPPSLASARVLKWTTLINIPFLLIAFMPLLLPGGVVIPNEFRLLALVGFGFPIAIGYPMTMTRIAEIFGSDTQRVTGLCVLYQATAAMLMHFLLGTGADFLGLEPALAAISIFSALGALISLGNLERVIRAHRPPN